MGSNCWLCRTRTHSMEYCHFDIIENSTLLLVDTVTLSLHFLVFFFRLGDLNNVGNGHCVQFAEGLE